MVMTRLSRWFRNLLERWLERYHEGPIPPKRLAEMALYYAATHPRATRAQWTEFAARHACEAYRTGYVRGLEWCERDLDRRDPAVDPEVLMDAAYNDRSWLDRPIQLGDEAAVVQDEPEDEREDAAEEEARYYEQQRQYRIRRQNNP